MTKKELLEAIEDMPMDAEMYLYTSTSDAFEPMISVAYYSGVNRIILESC